MTSFAFEIARLKSAFHRTVLTPGEDLPKSTAGEQPRGPESTGALGAVSIQPAEQRISALRLVVPDNRYTLGSFRLRIIATAAITRIGTVSATWERCLDRLEVDLTPEQFNTWIRPLHAVEDGSILRLLAPNHFVRDWVSKHFLDLIMKIVTRCESAATDVTVQVGSRKAPSSIGNGADRTTIGNPKGRHARNSASRERSARRIHIQEFRGGEVEPDGPGRLDAGGDQSAGYGQTIHCSYTAAWGSERRT